MFSKLLALVSLGLAATCGVVSAQTIDLYVSPGGSSSSSCTNADPCNLAQAENYIRTINGSMMGNIVANLAAGTYTLASTWAFTQASVSGL